MAIGNINNNNYQARYNTTTAATTAAAVRKEDETQKTSSQVDKAQIAANQDKFVKSSGQGAGVYTKPKNEQVSAEQLRAMDEQRVNSFQQMLRSMVAKQGQQSNLSLFGMNLNVTQADSAKAAASIAEGGEWSVDAVAGRLMDMAKALAGGDASKIGALRNAVQKGFDAAGVDLGGKLPSICQDTYTETMKRFDDWEQEANRAGMVSTD